MQIYIYLRTYLAKNKYLPSKIYKKTLKAIEGHRSYGIFLLHVRFFNIFFVQKLATPFHFKGVYRANSLQLKIISSFGNAKGRNKYSLMFPNLDWKEARRVATV